MIILLFQYTVLFNPNETQTTDQGYPFKTVAEAKAWWADLMARSQGDDMVKFHDAVIHELGPMVERLSEAN